MNYAKIIGAAVQLFPKRIRVTLIDAATGSSLGKFKIPAEQLPVAFNRPTTIEIDNINWRVIKADPILADDFLYTKKLTLQVQHAAKIDAHQLKFSLPTICNELPATGEASLFNDFTLEIAETDWRQMEFLPLTQSNMIEDTIKTVENILASQSNPLLGYEQQHIRNNVFQENLAIPWDGFCVLLTNPALGNILFNNDGLVQKGFAARTDSYTYYGIMENGLIRSLCLTQFEWADDEFMRVLSTYELSLIDWCNASCISAEAGEVPKSEFISI